MDKRTDAGDKLTNRSMPPGTIIPELVYNNLDHAVAWLCQAFGFRERLRIGNHRSQLILDGESIIAIENSLQPHQIVDSTDQNDRKEGQENHSLLVHIGDVDRHFIQAVESGAQIIHPPNDYPYGERQYTVRDIGGHVWTFSQSIADVGPREWGGMIPENPPVE